MTTLKVTRTYEESIDCEVTDQELEILKGPKTETQEKLIEEIINKTNHSIEIIFCHGMCFHGNFQLFDFDPVE